MSAREGVMMVRFVALSCLLIGLAGCASERHFALDTLWPLGNPNAPKATSETAQRALGKVTAVAPLQAQPGDVWPAAPAPIPTLSDIEKNSNLPLGQGYTPSLPSPYPPGQEPPPDAPVYSVPPGAVPQAVPGDAR